MLSQDQLSVLYSCSIYVFYTHWDLKLFQCNRKKRNPNSKLSKVHNHNRQTMKYIWCFSLASKSNVWCWCLKNERQTSTNLNKGVVHIIDIFFTFSFCLCISGHIVNGNEIPATRRNCFHKLPLSLIAVVAVTVCEKSARNWYNSLVSGITFIDDLVNNDSHSMNLQLFLLLMLLPLY